MPPESLLKFVSFSEELSNSELKVSLPDERSAPAQNAFPVPVIITAPIESCLFILSNTARRSFSIC